MSLLTPFWSCPACTFDNTNNPPLCVMCGHQRPEIREKQAHASWNCRICTYANNALMVTCEMCETPKENPNTSPNGIQEPVVDGPQKPSAFELWTNADRHLREAMTSCAALGNRDEFDELFVTAHPEFNWTLDEMQNLWDMLTEITEQKEESENHRPTTGGVAVIFVGETGMGKTSTIRILCREQIIGSNSAKSDTREPSLYHDAEDDRIVYIDTVGTNEAGKGDSEVMQQIVKFIYREKIQKVAVVWFTQPSQRMGGRIAEEAEFIQSLMNGNPQPTQNIWENTIVVVRGSKNRRKIADAQGALCWAAVHGAKSSGKKSSDDKPLGNVHAVFGYTCVDWENDEDVLVVRDYPDSVRHAEGLLFESEVKRQLKEALAQLDGVDMHFKWQKCVKCNAKGDERIISLVCHENDRLEHPGTRVHPGEVEYIHEWGKLQHCGTFIERHTGDFIEVKRHTGQTYKNGKSGHNKWTRKIGVRLDTTIRCTGCRNSIEFPGCIVDRAFWRCCNRDGRSAKGCVGEWSCCSADAESAPGCVRDCLLCPAQRREDDLKTAEMGCQAVMSCCGAKEGSNSGCVFDCCGLPNEIGCSRICKSCDRLWGDSRGCSMSAAHILIDCDEDEAIDCDDEPQFEPFLSRPAVKRLWKKLVRLEAPLRSSIARQVTEFDENSSLFQTFLNSKREIEEILSQLRTIFESEVEKCQELDYFRMLVKFEKWSKHNQQYRLAGEQYGAQQQREMLRDEIAWRKHVDEINELSERVRMEFENESLSQPMKQLVDMYPFVVVTQNLLRQVVGDLARECRVPAGRFYESGQKSLYRIWEKMAFHVQRRWDPDVWDMCRALVSFDTICEIAEACQMLCRDERVEVINVYNRFPREDRVDNWQDVMIHVRFRGVVPAVIAEIQLCLQSLTVLRRDLGGHDEYSAFRAASEVRRFVDPDGVRELEMAL